jgi:hypothetical protein
MRIDDDLGQDTYLTFDDTVINKNFNEIDQLISEISTTENILRKRNVNPKINYVSSVDLDDIDDVVINIDIPQEYFTNKERRIIQYDYSTTIFNLISTMTYLIAITIKVITFLVTPRREKIKVINTNRYNYLTKDLKVL